MTSHQRLKVSTGSHLYHGNVHERRELVFLEEQTLNRFLPHHGWPFHSEASGKQSEALTDYKGHLVPGSLRRAISPCLHTASFDVSSDSDSASLSTLS